MTFHPTLIMRSEVGAIALGSTITNSLSQIPALGAIRYNSTEHSTLGSPAAAFVALTVCMLDHHLQPSRISRDTTTNPLPQI